MTSEEMSSRYAEAPECSDMVRSFRRGEERPEGEEGGAGGEGGSGGENTLDPALAGAKGINVRR